MDSALAIADRGGLEAVTLRAIATDVGATPMALYTYFADKDALYEGMRDRAFARVKLASAARRSWRVMLDAAARSVFQLMREHPNWMPLVAHQSGPPTSALAFFDEVLELMVKDGFSLEEALCAYGSAMSFAVGSVLFEQMMMGGGDVIARRLALLKELVARAPGRYDNIASLASKIDRWSFDDVFDLGISSLLKGIEARPVRPRLRPARSLRAR
jgi:AcrR family transcriptional regulator